MERTEQLWLQNQEQIHPTDKSQMAQLTQDLLCPIKASVATDK